MKGEIEIYSSANCDRIH